MLNKLEQKQNQKQYQQLYTQFEKAKSSGAQVISTDYYLPSKLFKSTYKVSFEGNKYERANPVLNPGKK